jgi:hypothetical protein
VDHFSQLLHELLGLPLRTMTSTETLDGLQVSAQLELPSITITFTETLLLSLQAHGSLGRYVGGSGSGVGVTVVEMRGDT